MQNDGDGRVKSRAYELWEKEGRPEGKDKDHWSRAESESSSHSGAIATEAEVPVVVGKQAKRKASSDISNSPEAGKSASSLGKKIRGKNG